jgi:hypothetical protein
MNLIMLPTKLSLEVVYKVTRVFKFMASLAMMIPIWLMSLSLFHFTIVLNRFQLIFDALTPSVIQSYVDYTFTNQTMTIRIDPSTMRSGIEAYFSAQINQPLHPYLLTFNFFQSDQITLCETACFGVNTELSFQLYGQNFQFERHYQLVQP